MRIIVVEDDQDIREMIAITFEMYFQVNCITYSDVDSAVQFIEKNRSNIDLIISDLHMPKQTGGDLYQYLLENKINIPFVLMTAGSIEEIADFNDRSYLYGIIEKPNVFEGLQVIIQRLQHNISHEPIPSTEFVSIGINLLLALQKLPCDI